MSRILTIDERKEILLDIFDRFVKRCEEKGFRYFLYFGSLIGAVRHQGFIPWDDDIDVGMPRPDYEAFKKDILDHPLSDAITFNDYEHPAGSVYPFLFSKLGRSDIITESDGIKIHLGIDIWIFDAIPSDDNKRLEFFNSVDLSHKNKDLCLYYYNNRDNLFRYYMTRFRRALRIIFKYRTVMRNAERLFCTYDYESSEFCANLGNGAPWARRWLFRTKWFDAEYGLFEGRRCRIPLFSHDALKAGFTTAYIYYPPENDRFNHDNEEYVWADPDAERKWLGKQKNRQDAVVAVSGRSNEMLERIDAIKKNGKSVVSFYFTMAYILEMGENAINKLKSEIDHLESVSDSVYPIWVRQPFLDRILKKTVPDIYKGYKQLFDSFVEKGAGLTAVDIGHDMILPDEEGTNPLLEKALNEEISPSALFGEGIPVLEVCDSYYGSVSSYVYLFMENERKTTIIKE